MRSQVRVVDGAFVVLSVFAAFVLSQGHFGIDPFSDKMLLCQWGVLMLGIAGLICRWGWAVPGVLLTYAAASEFFFQQLWTGKAGQSLVIDAWATFAAALAGIAFCTRGLLERRQARRLKS